MMAERVILVTEDEQDILDLVDFNLQDSIFSQMSIARGWKRLADILRLQ